MFRYYSVTEKSEWDITLDSDDSMKALIEKGCAMVSILSVSDKVDDETNFDKLTYKGGLYFDIDNEGNLKRSISALKDLIKKLKDQGVDRQDIHVWASGKKGFHIIVEEKVFSSGRAVRYLPYIYKEMALELFVDGLDLNVYSGKRGRLWRQENVRRADNGQFKVRVLPEEVDRLTEERYKEITSNPRNVDQLGSAKEAGKLAVLFEVCKKRVSVKQKQKSKDIESKVSEAILAKYAEEPPGCIQKLIEEGDTEGTSNFNQAAMQLGVFIARSGMVRDVWEPLVKSMAHNVKSGSYKSERDRVDHIIGMIRYAASSPKMVFSRGALFSVIEPCGTCEICQSSDGEDPEVIEDDMAGIVEQPDGYYMKTKEGVRRISTYLIRPENFFTAKAQDTELTRRIGIEAEIEVNGKTIASTRLDETAWDSKSSLIKETRGITNLGFFGGDQEVQRLKHFLFSKEFDMGEIQQVYSAGIHRHTIGKRSTLVYVEPGFSVTAQKERDTHYVDGRVPAPPRVSYQDFPDKKRADFEEFEKTIRSLLKVNEKYIVGQLIGWFAACHLKVHLQSIENQFPILNVWGNAESGKTTTACLFACLHGCDYIMEDSPVSLGGATPWAVANFAASSTTVARLMDEFNKSKIKEANYNYFAEVMKAAWNSQTFSRGSITRSAKADGSGRSGAGVVDVKISGPIVVCSEQSPEMPALKQRMVQVNLSTKSREGCEDDFMTVMENREHLWQLSRAMVWSSLATLPSWTKERMKKYREYVPRKIEARTNYSYRVILTGLDFFGDVLKDLGLDLSEELTDLKSEVLNHLEGNEDKISRDKGKTEVDTVVEAFNTMAGMEDGNSGKTYLMPGVHYILADDKLYINLLMAHAHYKRYSRAFGERIVMTNLGQFETLLSQERYYMRSEIVPSIHAKRELAVLDMEEMKSKGLEVGSFHSALEGS